MTKSQQMPMACEVPEQMPQTMQALDRAITLLGSMLKVELRPKARQELEGLVGCLLTPQTAAVRKIALKRRRKSLIEQHADISQSFTSQSEVPP